MLTLAERLQSTVAVRFSSIDKDWVLYCQDHRDEIINDSERIILHDNSRNRFQFRLTEYLKHLKRNPMLMWLTLYINQLDTTADFTEDVEALIIPSETAVNALMQSYRSAQAKFNSVK